MLKKSIRDKYLYKDQGQELLLNVHDRLLIFFKSKCCTRNKKDKIKANLFSKSWSHVSMTMSSPPTLLLLMLSDMRADDLHSTCLPDRRAKLQLAQI